MTLYLDDPDFQLHVGDVRGVLATMPDESVHCVVTSPPYWGLRDYSVDGQLGLEATPDEYVANMVAVFREVRRVLRRDGTCWVNLGDSYASSGKATPQDLDERIDDYGNGRSIARWEQSNRAGTPAGLKQKDLVGIPWRVAFALQADGWYLRSDIIWAKPNPMPESVTDRPTKSHEYVFLLTRSPRYFFDQEAVREPHTQLAFVAQIERQRAKEEAALNCPACWGAGFETTDPEDSSPCGYCNGTGKTHAQAKPHMDSPADGVQRFGAKTADRYLNPAGRNVRSVWEIATQPYTDAHFATFPEELPRRCILASTSEYGVCPECGAPWERETGRDEQPQAYEDRKYDRSDPKFATKRNMGARYQAQLDANPMRTLGWRPSCGHGHLGHVPATVLDPFMGSGTTAHVARKLGRCSIGVELNPDYAALCARRLQQLSLLT